LNITTIINSIVTALSQSTTINDWCRQYYAASQTVYVGVDQRKPPADSEYPIISVFPIRKSVGYALEQKGHGVGITCGINEDTLTSSTEEINLSLVSATYKWTASGKGTTEYYCQLAAGGDPSLNEPGGIKINNVSATEGTVGTLTAGKWAYGDNNSLGYNTVYVRLSDGTDPDTKTAAYVKTADTVNVKEYDGVDKIEAFRKLVETAIVTTVSSPQFIDSLSIEYEVIEYFPFFLASMEFSINEDYYQGDNVFL